jgi:hypothetical protein
MTSHLKPARMTLDGAEWVEAWAYDQALLALAEKQRTTAAHNHQFAAIHDLYENLPISHAGAPYAASAEAFRKHGLIVTGHCDTDTLAMPSQEAAIAAAPFIAKTARKAHGYALTVVRGALIVCSTPHSQSFKAMGKERFQQSKADVLDWAETLLGVRA